MLRGEIWLGVWPNDPEKKQRPLLIISNNLRNKAPNLFDVNVLKLTSLQRSDGRDKPVHPSEDLVIILKKKTIIRCASIFTIEKSCLIKKWGQLPSTEISQVDARLRNVLDLNQ